MPNPAEQSQATVSEVVIARLAFALLAIIFILAPIFRAWECRWP